MDFSAINREITPTDANAMAAAQGVWDDLAKPLGSLGLLEAAIVKIAGLTATADVRLARRAVLVFCADNGVVAEHITQAGSEITALVTENIARGCSSVNRMAQIAQADVIPVDMGLNRPLAVPGLLQRRVADGTGNIARGPAMSRMEAVQAMRSGMELVRDCRGQGYAIIANGEMGIGNTATASAMAAVLLQKPAAEVTGRGAGLSDEGLQRKIAIIKQAIAHNQPAADDTLDVLAKLGGFDIAAMTGAFLGGALYRMPVLIDGFISAVAALTALRLCPAAGCAMLASHMSAEPAASLVLQALGLKPLITAGLRLGEGTGAVAALPLLDMALALYHGMSTFADIGMAAYTPQDGYRKC